MRNRSAEAQARAVVRARAGLGDTEIAHYYNKSFGPDDERYEKLPGFMKPKTSRPAVPPGDPVAENLLKRQRKQQWRRRKMKKVGWGSAPQCEDFFDFSAFDSFSDFGEGRAPLDYNITLKIFAQELAAGESATAQEAKRATAALEKTYDNFEKNTGAKKEDSDWCTKDITVSRSHKTSHQLRRPFAFSDTLYNALLGKEEEEGGRKATKDKSQLAKIIGKIKTKRNRLEEEHRIELRMLAEGKERKAADAQERREEAKAAMEDEFMKMMEHISEYQVPSLFKEGGAVPVRDLFSLVIWIAILVKHDSNKPANSRIFENEDEIQQGGLPSDQKAEYAARVIAACGYENMFQITSRAQENWEEWREVFFGSPSKPQKHHFGAELWSDFIITKKPDNMPAFHHLGLRDVTRAPKGRGATRGPAEAVPKSSRLSRSDVSLALRQPRAPRTQSSQEGQRLDASRLLTAPAPHRRSDEPEPEPAAADATSGSDSSADYRAKLCIARILHTENCLPRIESTIDDVMFIIAIKEALGNKDYTAINKGGSISASRVKELAGKASVLKARYSHNEVAHILLGELAILLLLGIPLGWAVGFGLASFVVTAMQTELYRVPLVLTGQTLALAANVVILSALISGFITWWRLRKLDLVAVLKTRE